MKIKLFRVSEVTTALEKTYKNITKKKPKYDYDGPLLTLSEILSCSPNIDEQLTEEGINYHLEKDRSKLNVVLLCAFQLGIEQGMNICANDIFKLPVSNWCEEDWKDFEHKVKFLIKEKHK